MEMEQIGGKEWLAGAVLAAASRGEVSEVLIGGIAGAVIGGIAGRIAANVQVLRHMRRGEELPVSERERLATEKTWTGAGIGALVGGLLGLALT